MTSETEKSSQAERSRPAAWCQLLRVPNLPTAAGDPLAGFVMAGGLMDWTSLITVLPCMVASTLLYAGGIILNDLFDIQEDHRERPGRPLPSGQILPGAAAVVAAILILSAVATAWLAGVWTMLTAVVLSGVIFLYNSAGKHSRCFGPWNMGLCRGLSVLLGAAAHQDMMFSPPALAAGFIVCIFVVAITRTAQKETTPELLRMEHWYPAAVLGGLMSIWLGAGARLMRTSLLDPMLLITETPLVALTIVVGIVLFFWAFARGIRCGLKIEQAPTPQNVQASIGKLIRTLLLVQATLVLIGGVYKPQIALALAGGLMILWIISALLGRRFYAS